MEPLIHMPSDTDPGLPSLVVPDKNHILDLRGRAGATDKVLLSMRRAGLLKGLRAVDLGYCERVTDESLELLSGVPTLTRLSVEGCPGVTPAGLASLVALPELRALDVSGCKNFDDRALAVVLCIPGLKILTLRRTPVTAAGFRSVPGSVRLQRLDVRGCEGVSAGDLDAIARRLHLGRHDIIHDSMDVFNELRANS